MEQNEVIVGKPTGKKKKIWLPIAVVLGIAALVVIVLVVLTHALHRNGSRPAPVMLAAESHYSMYEERSDEVLLTYAVTLRNDTDEDMANFSLRAVLQSDYKSGYLLSPDAKVRQWGEQYSTFTLAAGQTQTFDLILTARFHKTQRTASGDLPQLYAIYPDGSEGWIDTVQK